RIKLIKEKLDEIAKAKEKQEKIEKLLADGNALFGSSKWTEAKAKYEEVLKLDDKNETAKGQLKLINEQLEAEKEAAEQEKNFLALVKEGDQFVTGKKFKEAIDKYTAALALKADAEVQGKIDAAKIEIDKIENAAKIKQQYDDAIKQG